MVDDTTRTIKEGTKTEIGDSPRWLMDVGRKQVSKREITQWPSFRTDHYSCVNLVKLNFLQSQYRGVVKV